MTSKGDKKGLEKLLSVFSDVRAGESASALLLMVARWTKILENSTDYSIMNTVNQALWLPTTREAKYKAKAAVDTFCWRGGDVLQAGIVYVGSYVGIGITGFSWLNVALTVAWLLAASRIYSEHRKREFQRVPVTA